MTDNPLLLRIFILFVLLLLSAFFSACEASFFSIHGVRIESLRKNGHKSVEIISKLLKNPRKLLVTIYLGNELVNVAFAAVTTSIMITAMGDSGLGFAIVLSTVLVLQFGEIIPKTFAINNPESFARFAAYPINMFSILVSPIQRVISLLSTYAVMLLGGEKYESESTVTEEEIKTLVDLGEEVGELPANEKEMIHSVFGFADKSVSEVMTPRTDIFYLEAEESIDSVMEKVANNYYSRIPVFEDNIDNIVGILYLKDLLPYTDSGKKRPNLKDLLQTPFMIPETKKINDLLKDFQKKNVHIAIVLDEHAGVSGLVTLDDLMVEIFGDIESKKEILFLEEGKYRIFGKTPIEEFNEEMGSTIPCEEFDTIGGFIFHAIGRVPKRGETVEHENLQFTVEKMKGPRIISLRLQKKASPATTEQNVE